VETSLREAERGGVTEETEYMREKKRIGGERLEGRRVEPVVCLIGEEQDVVEGRIPVTFPAVSLDRRPERVVSIRASGEKSFRCRGSGRRGKGE